MQVSSPPSTNIADVESKEPKYCFLPGSKLCNDSCQAFDANARYESCKLLHLLERAVNSNQRGAAIPTPPPPKVNV